MIIKSLNYNRKYQKLFLQYIKIFSFNIRCYIVILYGIILSLLLFLDINS